MAFGHGKTAVFKLADSGATLRDLSSYLDNLNMPRSIDANDTTTFGVTGGAKTFIVGLNEAKVSGSGKFDIVADGYLNGVLGQSTLLAFEYGPLGSTAGMRKFTGTCMLTSYDIKSSVNDVVAASIEFQISGPVTPTTW